MRQAAACECGQVLFDIVDRKAGDTLTCPWCNRDYLYLGDGKVEKKGAPGSGDKIKAEIKDSEKKEEKKERDKKEEQKTYLEVKHLAEREVRKTENQTNKLSPVDSLSPRTSRRIKPRKEDVPGGFPIMIGFIIGFNGMAFIGLAIIRSTALGRFFPENKTWPLIVALVVGHIVGFIAWSTFVYYREKTKAGVDPGQPSQPLDKKA
jgi:hypothetical protein